MRNSILLLLVVLLSCGTRKNGELQHDPTQDRLTGTVRIENGCGALIEARAGKYDIVIYPDNLEEQYQVNGTKIRFFFRNSSLPVPVPCRADARGNVAEVIRIR